MAYSKLGRNTAARKALLRNMVTSLLQHERIETTETKAKELRRVADQMITLGKRGDEKKIVRLHDLFLLPPYVVFGIPKRAP